MHPGVVETDLFRFLPAAAVDAMKERSAAQGLATKTPAQGAATTVYAATAPSLAEHGGAFLGECRIAKAAPHASSADDAERLWAVSEKLVGETF